MYDKFGCRGAVSCGARGARRRSVSTGNRKTSGLVGETSENKNHSSLTPRHALPPHLFSYSRLLPAVLPRLALGKRSSKESAKNHPHKSAGNIIQSPCSGAPSQNGGHNIGKLVLPSDQKIFAVETHLTSRPAPPRHPQPRDTPAQLRAASAASGTVGPTLGKQ